jgi:hypothetical protein
MAITAVEVITASRWIEAGRFADRSWLPFHRP